MDVVAAALLAASPNGARIHELAGPLTYVLNGAGLPFNAACAGFGALDSEQFAENMRGMAAMRSEHPSLTTQEIYLDTNKFRQTAPGQYTLHIDQQATVIRFHLTANFNRLSEHDLFMVPVVPDKLILKSPDGMEIIINPGQQGSGDDDNRQYAAIGTTSGFLGSGANGDWQVIVPKEYTISGLNITLDAVMRGGIIDHMIAEKAAEIKAKSAVKNLMISFTMKQKP